MTKPIRTTQNHIRTDQDQSTPHHSTPPYNAQTTKGGQINGHSMPVCVQQNMPTCCMCLWFAHKTSRKNMLGCFFAHLLDPNAGTFNLFFAAFWARVTTQDQKLDIETKMTYFDGRSRLTSVGDKMKSLMLSPTAIRHSIPGNHVPVPTKPNL